MTVREALAKFKDFEWYDNHRLEAIQACHRYSFYHLIGPQGTPLGIKVGPAADFGSVWHAAMAAYYDKRNLGRAYSWRVAKAAQAFAIAWQRSFANLPLIENKYKLARGLQQMIMYFDHFRNEDEFFEIVASEDGFAMLIRPRPGEQDFKPFVFAGRMDRCLHRVTMNDYVVGETKTTGGDPVSRMKELRLDRQTLGYYAILEAMGKRISGVLADVVQITATKITNDIFVRDYIQLDPDAGALWRLETIGIVEQWRKLLARAEALSAANAGNLAVLSVFDRRTKNCTSYGLCHYYDLCQYGINADTMSRFFPDTWHPLAEDEDVKVIE